MHYVVLVAVVYHRQDLFHDHSRVVLTQPSSLHDLIKELSSFADPTKHIALSSMLLHEREDQRTHIFSNLLCDDEETFVVLEELVHPHNVWMVLFIKAKMRS